MEERNKILSTIRNPLSIIALFVLFTEVIASLTLMNNSLTDGQRWWLVVFCVVFPFLVLSVFTLLSWFRPINLYGPMDFSNEQIYLMLMKKGKIEDEVDEIVNPEENISEENRVSIIGQIAKSEQLALSELRKEFKAPIRREVRSMDSTFLFDGVIERAGSPIYVEVKYAPRGFLGSASIAQIRRFVNMANKSEKIIAIVTPMALNADEIEGFNSAIKAIDPNIGLRFYTL